MTYLAYNSKISGPATINSVSHKLTINPIIWKDLPDTFKKFVLLHEHGHLELNTNDELAADNFAFQHLFQADPEGFQDNARIISSMLPFTTIGHFERLKNAYIKSLEPGKNDPEIIKEIEKLNQAILFQKKKPIYNLNRDYLYDYDQEKVHNFLGNLFKKLKGEETFMAESRKKQNEFLLKKYQKEQEEILEQETQLRQEKVLTDNKKKNRIYIIIGLFVLVAILTIIALRK